MGFHVWVLAPSEHVAAFVLSWAKGACCGGCDSIAFDLPSGGLIGEREPPSEHPCPPECECGGPAAWFPHVAAVFLVCEFVGLFIELHKQGSVPSARL